MPALLSPNLGLYLGTSSLTIPKGGLQDGMNFRIKQGKLSNRNMGWGKFSTNFTLNGPCVLIDNFFPRGATEHLLFGSLTDIYRYVSGTDNVVYLTPRYEVGTASASGTAVTGTSTLWATTGAIKPGDEITFGTAGITDPAATWFVVSTVDTEVGITLTATAGTVADGPYTIRRLFQGLVNDLWSFEVFVDDGASGDDLWLATNGVDDPISWNGDLDQVTLHPEFNFTASVVSVYSNMTIWGDCVVNGVSKPTSILNSDPGSPLLVGDVGVGLAGEFKVHGSTDPIQNMLPLGDTLTIYSSATVTQAQFVEDPFVFIFRQVVQGVGAVGHNAIADFGDFHIFIANDSMYTFDGVAITVRDEHIWRSLIRQMDPLRLPSIYGHFAEEDGDLIWSVPLTTDADSGDVDGQNEIAYPLHYLEEQPQGVKGAAYAKRSFPFQSTGFFERAAGITWADLVQQWQDTNFQWTDNFFSAGFPQSIAGDKTGQIWILAENQDADGVALTSFVHFPRIAMETGRERDLLARVYPYVEPSSGTLDVTVHMSDFAAGAVTTVDTFAFDLSLPEGLHFVSPYRIGRFASIEFGSDGDVWVLQGFNTDVKRGSLR